MGQEYSRLRMGLSCPNSTTWPRSARPAQRVPGVNLGGYRLALRPRGRPAPPLPRAYDIGTNMAVGYLERPEPSAQMADGLRSGIPRCPREATTGLRSQKKGPFSHTTSAAIVFNGRQGTSTEPPLMPTQPPPGPWGLVKG